LISNRLIRKEAIQHDLYFEPDDERDAAQDHALARG